MNSLGRLKYITILFLLAFFGLARAGGNGFERREFRFDSYLPDSVQALFNQYRYYSYHLFQPEPSPPAPSSSSSRISEGHWLIPKGDTAVLCFPGEGEENLVLDRSYPPEAHHPPSESTATYYIDMRLKADSLGNANDTIATFGLSFRTIADRETTFACEMDPLEAFMCDTGFVEVIRIFQIPRLAPGYGIQPTAVSLVLKTTGKRSVSLDRIKIYDALGLEMVENREFLNMIAANARHYYEAIYSKAAEENNLAK
jgi:hypothetical protein